ncbi:Zinc finger, MIZ-type domain-containing protein [Strongyloides ratti]|uniref:Zinc finger, MIZ-type domain-containing protein n=1 Tax=Strongyloides ratti TaxID=34506 RepID=A0A090KYQ8_STRRB|nr:Zinc finger, MIZ-type domain-containing protein [Strongyloides ratti]CEF62645.1 Zinc finger, MIZ-type domain-containing protein [Strongyloides ratti]
MNGQNNPELVQCMTWILHEFTKDDLKSCLNILKRKSSDNKTELQTTLLDLLLTSQNENGNVTNVIFNQAATEGYSFNVKDSYNNLYKQDYLPIVCNFPEDYNSINKNKIYFHKDIKRITEWKIVGPRNRKQPTVFKLFLPHYFCNSLSRQIPYNYSSSNLLLKCTQIFNNNQIIQLDSYYPPKLQIFINGREFTGLLPREVYRNNSKNSIFLPAPAILNNAILKFPRSYASKSRRKIVTIKLCYDTTDNEDTVFGFGLFTSVSVSWQMIRQKILKRSMVSIENFSTKLSNYLSKKESMKYLEISLFSPLICKRIQTPFRGKNCDHLNPEDLDIYLKFNMDKELWLCTICNKPCTPDDIIVDEFFVKILNKHSNVKGIVVFEGLNYCIINESDIFSVKDL